MIFWSLFSISLILVRKAQWLFSSGRFISPRMFEGQLGHPNDQRHLVFTAFIIIPFVGFWKFGNHDRFILFSLGNCCQISSVINGMKGWSNLRIESRTSKSVCLVRFCLFLSPSLRERVWSVRDTSSQNSCQIKCKGHGGLIEFVFPLMIFEPPVSPVLTSRIQRSGRLNSLWRASWSSCQYWFLKIHQGKT